MKLVVTSGEHPTLDIRKIPEHEMDNFARATLRAVERYFKTPGAQEEYEKWLIEYEKEESGEQIDHSGGTKNNI